MYNCLSPLRQENTPSCKIYPPGVGRMGGRGWTFCDFGGGDHTSGDALSLSISALNLSFPEAAYRLAQYTPTPSVWLGDAPQARPRVAPVVRQVEATVQAIPAALQRQGMRAFLDALIAEVPDAAEAGRAYQRSRGCTDRGIDLVGTAYRIPSSAASEGIADRLMRDRAGLEAAWHSGLVYFLQDSNRQRGRIPWVSDGEVVLFPCLARDCVTPVYVTGRRMEWTKGDIMGKYRGQSLRHGAQRAPYGLPSLIAAAAQHGCLHICEGPTDVGGAVSMGMPALGMLFRPNAHGIDDETSATARQLTWLLPLLRECSKVVVLPDNDDTAAKQRAGDVCGSRLAQWLNYREVNAELGSMAGIGLGDYKDLGDAAKAINCGE